MRFFLSAILCLLLSGCTEQSAKKPDTKKPDAKTYSVTFAVALLPDTLLQQFGGTVSKDKGYKFTSFDDRYRLAAHVLKNSDKYAVCRQGGGWTPLVRTGNESQMELSKQKAAETFTLNSTGVSLNRFDIAVAVENENDSGQISCHWGGQFDLTLQKPIGNSTGHGGSHGSGYVLYSGKPDMTPLFSFEGQTLWTIIGLRRQ